MKSWGLNKQVAVYKPMQKKLKIERNQVPKLKAEEKEKVINGGIMKLQKQNINSSKKIDSESKLFNSDTPEEKESKIMKERQERNIFLSNGSLKSIGKISSRNNHLNSSTSLQKLKATPKNTLKIRKVKSVSKKLQILDKNQSNTENNENKNTTELRKRISSLSQENSQLRTQLQTVKIERQMFKQKLFETKSNNEKQLLVLKQKMVKKLQRQRSNQQNEQFLAARQFWRQKNQECLGIIAAQKHEIERLKDKFLMNLI